MTDAQQGDIITAVKRSHWNPEIGMRMYLKRHPEVVPEPIMYAVAVGVGRTPFPNILGLKEGPFPEDKARPWHDTRYWRTAEQMEWEKGMAEL
jgi:hypothetical protein